MLVGDHSMTPPQTVLHKTMSMAPKIHSPYEAIMRKFTEDHKLKCSSVEVDAPKERRCPEKQFMTGSKYEGSWDVLGMAGPNAVYTFPNGVIFEGEFEDGMMHGMGEMRYPTGEIITGRYHCGHMVERTLTFADGLEYSESDWMYCRKPDRRFTLEYEKGVMPASISYMTADLPTREIPPGYYDTGDGFYDPKTKMVYKDDGKTTILRAPMCREQEWIEENCRYAPIDQMGPRRDLYEEWVEPDTDPAPPSLPAAVSRATAWMFESNRSMMAYDSDNSYNSKIFSVGDFSKWYHRNRPSKHLSVEEPLTEQQSTGKSETDYILKPRSAVKKSTSDSRLRTHSADKHTRTPQTLPRSTIRKST